MFLNNLKRSGIIGIGVALFAVLIFLGLSKSVSNPRSVAAQDVKSADESNRLKTENSDLYRSNMISQKLSTLFSNAELNFNETKLLPDQVGGSKTIQINFKSADSNQSEREFFEQKPSFNLLKQTALQTSDKNISRQRAFEPSPTQILIVSADRDKQILWWDLQPDPRVFRAESADDNGLLSGKILYRASADILISIPAAKEITALYFYSPKWNGEKYSLELIGELDLQSE
jgi:hypothetical protein